MCKNLKFFYLIQNLNLEAQRSIFGELLYPKIKQYTQDTDRTARITGMLIDFEVFEVEDIIELVNKPN